ncbi:MAG: phosphoribosylformylglycinamidine synthase subunit PurL [Geminicoccaceae bacterium]
MSDSGLANSTITLEAIREHGLDADEYDRICEILGRAPNLLELGVFSVMWSEHCSYKSSKVWLRTLPTEAPWVICGPGENAGVVDIGEGLVAVFKMESHNHPSFIEPYQGAATGVGGILRDVFTMGARPVALMNSLRFSALDHPKTKALVQGVVGGIGGYGYCIGVPTVVGETTFDASFNGNILVNAMCVGIAQKDKVFYARASGVGNPVLYVGAKTGRDGIHGATMASAEFSDDTAEKRPTVQVGDPFKGRLLLEACLELMAGDCIVAIQDMGAAGITSSSFEMASRGETGIELDLDRVPMRERGMTPYEIMLSESQERMLVILEAGREAEAEAIFAKWELDCATIGHVTDGGRMVLRWHGEVVGDLPIAPVAGAAPEYRRPIKPGPSHVPVAAERIYRPMMPADALLKLLASPDLADKRWIWRQYDHTVMADTVAGPGGDAAIIRLHGSERGLAITCDCTPRYGAADAKLGGMQAVAEAYRNLSAVGAQPLAVTDCLNFGNPERPRIMGQFADAVTGMAEACRALDFPVVSGNVSLYNETEGRAIQPTPTIGGVGLVEDLDRIAGLRFTGENQVLMLVGESYSWLGSSLYLRDVVGDPHGAPPPVDLAAERRHGAMVRQLIGEGSVTSCHDLSDGGLAVALAEMVLASGMGAQLRPPRGDPDPAGWLFGEEQGRYLLAVNAEDERSINEVAGRAGVVIRTIGRTGGDALTLTDGDAISLEELAAAHMSGLEDLFR